MTSEYDIVRLALDLELLGLDPVTADGEARKWYEVSPDLPAGESGDRAQPSAEALIETASGK